MLGEINLNDYADMEERPVSQIPSFTCVVKKNAAPGAEEKIQGSTDLERRKRKKQPFNLKQEGDNLFLKIEPAIERKCHQALQLPVLPEWRYLIIIPSREAAKNLVRKIPGTGDLLGYLPYFEDIVERAGCIPNIYTRDIKRFSDIIVEKLLIQELYNESYRAAFKKTTNLKPIWEEAFSNFLNGIIARSKLLKQKDSRPVAIEHKLPLNGQVDAKREIGGAVVLPAEKEGNETAWTRTEQICASVAPSSPKEVQVADLSEKAVLFEKAVLSDKKDPSLCVDKKADKPLQVNVQTHEKKVERVFSGWFCGANQKTPRRRNPYRPEPKASASHL